MGTKGYELLLSDITIDESILFDKDFGAYKQAAFSFLNHKGKHLFSEDILGRYREGKTLENILSEEKDHFIPGSNRIKGGKMQRTFYDIQSGEEIKQADDFFDFFFSCKLRHLNLLEIAEFLSFHLDYSFDHNGQAYINFLNNLGQYHGRLLSISIIDKLNEWIKTNQESDDNADIEKAEKIKGRILREPGDHLTSLNLNQTALLIQFMQQAGIILKGDYLTYTQAGKAFNLLTGYSSHTIRQQLGTKGEIEGVKHEDYKELHEIIMRIASLIDTKIHKK